MLQTYENNTVPILFFLYVNREEAIVMANLRKRVAACDLERKRPTQKTEETRINETNQEQSDNRPLIIKVSFIEKF